MSYNRTSHKMSMHMIQEADYVRKDVIKYITINVTSITLYTSVSLSIGLYDVNQNIVTNVNMDIEGEDYLQWGSNDTYLIDVVCKRLGFTSLGSDV